MPYVSLYRKYRSQTFDDVMGQEHVTKTLQNAIRQSKVAHAYLFCGTRGTGKTTTARLLAKAVNCEKGPSPEPCNECSACRSITQGSAMDIIELDAASHRGIGDVKDINENVKFPPMELRYKVFIIDEAHQLSNDAKDAFLKTLEEPPAHTIFILATTEPQSIPVTIRSRCQQFDFRRGSLKDISDRLSFVAESEGTTVEPEALDLMAVSADGSWRDSLSLFEQVLAYTDGQVTVDDVNTVLGTVGHDFLFRLVDTLALGSERGAFQAATDVVESGKDIQQLIKSLAQHFRNLLFVRVAKDSSDVTTNKELADKLEEQASKFEKQALLKSVEILTEAEKEIRLSDQHRLILELSLLKILEAFRPQARPTEAAVHAAAEPPAEESRPPQTKPTPATKPVTAPKPDQTAETAAPQQSLPEFDRIQEKWGLVLQHVKSVNISAHALFQDVIPTGVRNGSLVLQFKGEGQKNLIAKETERGKGISKRRALLMGLERVFGVANAGIICEIAQDHDGRTQKSDGNDLPNPFEDNPTDDFQNVLEIFPNANIVDE